MSNEKIITPSNGRIVWFTPGSGDRSINGVVRRHSEQPMAAMIVHVWGDRMVNLSVTDHDGYQHPMSSVDLLQPGDDRGQLSKLGRYCEWMPYQKGQAAKTEQVADELAKAVAEINPNEEKITGALGCCVTCCCGKWLPGKPCDCT